LCSLPGRDCATADLPPGFREDVVASGLTVPTSFAFLPDRRVLVAEKEGVIRLVEDGHVRERAFLDIRERVNTYSLRGLLTLELDPAFAQNGLLYVLYAFEDGRGPARGPRRVRVSRFQTVADLALPDTEKVLLGTQGRTSCNRLPPGSDCIPADGDQVGGDIKFGAHGMMFVSTGDGADEEEGVTNSIRAQDIDSLAGKLIRVTRTGRGRQDNPFWTGDPDAARSKVWAYGFRNPFRITIRRGSDIAYVGDVGWDSSEEIDAGTRGANLGWPCYEGSEPVGAFARDPMCRRLRARSPSNLRPAVFSYPTQLDPRRASVTGGVFYSRRSYPAQYRGVYFFGDWAANWIRYLRIDSLDRVALEKAEPFLEEANGPVELEVGPDGDLYYLASKVGELRRIVYRG
jgi:glucose/arabinose dehydrogenase